MESRVPDSSEITAPPRPSIFIVVNSLLVIGASIFLMSFFLCVGILSDWSMSFWCLLPLVIGLLQYSACFRKSFSSAKALIYFHYLGTFFFFVQCVCAVGMMSIGEQPIGIMITLAVVWLAYVVLAGVNGWLMYRWSRQLDAARLASPEDLFRKERPFQISIKELFYAITATAIVAGLTSWMVQWHVFEEM